MHRRTVLTGTASAVLSAGCLGVVPDDSAARTVDRLRERTDRVESVAGRVSMETVVDGRRTRSETVDVWSIPDRKLKVETGDGADGSQLVVDESETWLYDPESNRAVHLPFAVEGGDPVDHGPIVDELDGYDVEHRGREEVAGRTADHIDCTPTGAAEGPELEYYTFSIGPEPPRDLVPRRIELWVDGEYGYPLARTDHTEHGRTTAAFEEVTFQREIPDDRFAFEPPPDVEVRDDAAALANRHESIERAEAHAGFRTAVPDRVEDYELDYASVTYYEGGTSIVAYFRNAGERTSIRARPTERAELPTPPGETVLVDGGETTAGRIRAIPDETVDREFVTNRFRCDGLHYVVTGPSHESVATLTDSIACS